MAATGARAAKYARRRKKRMAKVEHDLSAEQWAAVQSEWGGCAYCGVAGRALQRDCVLAISRGGRYTLDNIVPACGSCNASKCNDEVTGWLRRKKLDERRFLERYAEISAAMTQRFPAIWPPKQTMSRHEPDWNAMNTSPNSVEFTASLFQAPGKTATGIVVPPEVIAQLDAGKRPAVRVSLNGYEYRTTVGVMGGEHLIPVSAAHRAAAGLAAGDTVQVELVSDTSERAVDVPADLDEAFSSNPRAGTFFHGLSNSLQRYHVDNITGAKSVDTRQRRVAKAIELFLAGKKR